MALKLYPIVQQRLDNNIANEIISTLWQNNLDKLPQGLLKRAYSVDFEKYHPDGLVEIYIAVVPHC